MSTQIKVISAYGPRIKMGRTVKKDELISLLADRTGLNRGEVGMVLDELSDALVFFNRAGRGVRLEGIGTYHPRVGLDGSIKVSHILDRSIRNRLNAPGFFLGEIVNRENIGKSMEELVERWNAEHPDDPVQ